VIKCEIEIIWGNVDGKPDTKPDTKRHVFNASYASDALCNPLKLSMIRWC